ncbi:hypothetical protein [Halomonas dongshanensis]|uniref:DUF883 domain-containing protein n=1 Tax=Halomonas dongshanensis TaxID=2890835 RepID=A0ABT2EBJ9_9GAMM|nr:hypothetical protein [Halomonas dongshanensis]MCS2608465.1 hypothetical protein [Halomonas dongshanensis]
MNNSGMNDQEKSFASHAAPGPGAASPHNDPHQDPHRLDTERLKAQGREAAHDIHEAASQQAEHVYDHQRQVFAQQATTFTKVMNKTADEFESQHQPFFSQQARRMAKYADSVSHQLRDKDLKRICHDAQDYSRREPALFIGGMMAAGFLVARFLRSSQHHHHADTSASQGDPTIRPPSTPPSSDTYS